MKSAEKRVKGEGRVMSQKERVDLIEVDLLDMCKYILSKWVFILIGIVVFAGAGFGYAKVKGKTEYSSKMQVYVTVPKTSDKVLIRDNAGDLAYDYAKLIDSDIITKKISKKTKISKEKIKDALSAEQIDGTRILEIRVKSKKKNYTEKISDNVIPVFQNVVTKNFGKSSPIIINNPSKIKKEASISAKKMIVLGAIAGAAVVIMISFITYMIRLFKDR